MVVLSDRDTLALGTSPEYAAWLGRDVAGVVGHNCREWCHPDHWEQCLRLHQEAIDQGATRSLLRQNVRPDGELVTGLLIIRPVRTIRGRFLAFSASRIVSVKAESLKPPRPKAYEIAAYAEEMAKTLADMVGRAGLPRLQESFELVAGEAGELAARLTRGLN